MEHYNVYHTSKFIRDPICHQSNKRAIKVYSLSKAASTDELSTCKPMIRKENTIAEEWDAAEETNNVILCNKLQRWSHNLR